MSCSLESITQFQRLLEVFLHICTFFIITSSVPGIESFNNACSYSCGLPMQADSHAAQTAQWHKVDCNVYTKSYIWHDVKFSFSPIFLNLESNYHFFTREPCLHAASKMYVAIAYTKVFLVINDLYLHCCILSFMYTSILHTLPVYIPT